MVKASRFVPVPQSSIILEMDEEVAETLVSILNNVGGQREGRRGHAEDLLSALVRTGIHGIFARKDIQRSEIGGMPGSIYFNSTITRG